MLLPRGSFHFFFENDNAGAASSAPTPDIDTAICYQPSLLRSLWLNHPTSTTVTFLAAPSLPLWSLSPNLYRYRHRSVYPCCQRSVYRVPLPSSKRLPISNCLPSTVPPVRRVPPLPATPVTDVVCLLSPLTNHPCRLLFAVRTHLYSVLCGWTAYS